MAVRLPHHRPQGEIGGAIMDVVDDVHLLQSRFHLSKCRKALPRDEMAPMLTNVSAWRVQRRKPKRGGLRTPWGSDGWTVRTRE